MALTKLYFTHHVHENPAQVTEIGEMAILQLEEYFTKKRNSFTLPINPYGTDFQKKVWKALLDIPFGYTYSYLKLAQKLGDSNLTRAVGNANGKNPIPIIIPCHRVIGENGDLTGYSMGLDRKKWLLDFESSIRFPKLF
ncbi:MAG: methylated-DNA--[protein]-cysteine S-methyltransferase [Bacteroidetes bacterium]|nr:methylated-DNA--[protein]-cysteine S-methyltransferase [Bacteroidota bacterium]